MITDFLIVQLAFYCGYHTYMKVTSNIYLAPNMRASVYYFPRAEHFYITLALVFGLLLIFYNVLRKYYRGDNSLLHVKEYEHIFASYITVAIATCALYFVYYVYLTRDHNQFVDKLFSRRIFCYSVFYGFLLTILFRTVFNWLLEKLHAHGFFVRNCVILGAGNNGRLVGRRLLNYSAHHFLPLCFLDDFVEKGTEVEVEKGKKPIEVEGTIEELPEIIKRFDINAVFFCMTGASLEKIYEVMDVCLSHNISFYFTPRIYVMPQIIRPYEIAGLCLITFLNDFSVSWYYNFVKRAFDIILSVLLLLPGIPVMLLTALAIKLDSKGPVFFKQERVGLNGKVFTMYKFRSMYVENSGSEVKPKSGKDPRITRVGHFLRLTSLDELPQILNVFCGDMSFVGPRPEMTFIVDSYDRWQRIRLKVKPGITGLWQISADRNVPIHENLDYDIFYIQERSLLLDLVIMFQTFFFIARGI